MAEQTMRTRESRAWYERMVTFYEVAKCDRCGEKVPTEYLWREGGGE